MGLLSGYRPLVRRIGSFKLSGNGKRRPAVTKTLSTLSTNQLLLKDAGSQADDSLHGQKMDDHGESHKGGDSSHGSSRPRNEMAAMEGNKGGGGEEPAASGSTEEERSLRTTRSGGEGNHSASSPSSLSSGDRRKEEDSEQDQELEWQRQLGSADFPGSPSFREYCHISISDAEDSGEDGDYRLTDDEPSHERKGSMDSTTSTTTDQRKALPPAAKDRFRRLRVLTRAPIAMLNVRSCYHRCSSSQESPRLLVGKSPS